MAQSSLLPYFVLGLVICLDRSMAQQDTIHEGFLHMPIIHSTNTQYFKKRDVAIALTNRSDIAYYAQLNLGTPAQPVHVQLDTGSFELWVNPTCSNLEGSDASFCRTVGHYNSAQSSTSVSLGKGKTLNYGIGSANISYFEDDIAMPGSTTALKDVQFGVATSSVEEFSGILGIGYGEGIATNYKNFVDQLSAQNATKVKAFTVALGSKEEQEGVVIFGGVDTSRFSGKLAKLPIIPADQSPDGVPRYWINMQSLSLTAPGGTTRSYANSTIPVFLDTGSTMTLLPADLTQAIAEDFGSSQPDASGFYEVSCDLMNVNGTLDFAFAGTTVSVSYQELIRYVAGDPPTCYLGISPSDTFTLLGDTFMRSAYAVFDLDDNIIWMTQAANCGSTPAALQNTSVMSTLTGACNVDRALTLGDNGGTTGTTVTGSVASSSSTPSASVSTASLAASPTAVTGSESSVGLKPPAVPRALGSVMIVLASAWWLVV